jgi:hypothetical protein
VAKTMVVSVAKGKQAELAFLAKIFKEITCDFIYPLNDR